MLENTTVAAKFSILGDEFPTHVITETLNLLPTNVYHKGELSKTNRPRQETCWTLGTLYEESFDINNQLNSIISKIKPQTENLLQLKAMYSLSFSFMIVIQIENNDKPAIYLEVDTIHFASEIGASINFDYYIYS
ncbi:DUF4279 domain-containing protein [Paenibacillus sp. GCM10012307]|uniref:DUF4279 domain-containing protein n=1 Tax=Paenibacillus roseus TaxID=2798579 RepID=A0A934MXA0_9BACL|nr:DUF4279 domain-containing protein [Paenibacillus roseus]MBJ6363972.1 DUF4279 domain-containing protein [Paenibacillus roseus]